MNAWAITSAILGGLLLLWLTLVLTLWYVAHRESKRVNLRDMLRLGALLVYLVIPIDLIPDFIPIVGYADDIVLVALVLRSVARRAGPEAIDRHWPGTPEGLMAIRTLTGYSSQVQ